MNRFEYQYPELASELRQAPVEKQRAACLVACDYAVEQAKVEYPLVMEALRKMRVGEFITEKDKRDLAALVEKLDNEYFCMEEGSDEGYASIRDYQESFAKARAVAAVLYSFDANPYDAASEAIYEADAVTDEDGPGVLLPAVKAVLK